MTPVGVKLVPEKAGTAPAKVRSARRAKRFVFIENPNFVFPAVALDRGRSEFETKPAGEASYAYSDLFRGGVLVKECPRVKAIL